MTRGSQYRCSRVGMGTKFPSTLPSHSHTQKHPRRSFFHSLTHTHGWTDGRTNGRTNTFIELRVRDQKKRENIGKKTGRKLSCACVLRPFDLFSYNCRVCLPVSYKCRVFLSICQSAYNHHDCPLSTFK